MPIKLLQTAQTVGFLRMCMRQCNILYLAKIQLMSALAYCIVAQSPMRSEPSDKSEMVSQLLFGESCTLREEQSSWCSIQSTHDGYIGWVDRKHLIVSQLAPQLTPMPSVSVWSGNGCEIHRLSPGAMASLDAASISIGDGEFHRMTIEKQPNDVLAFAYQYLGTPYLWGGRSLYGIDCSGYTQIIARFAGLSIPRDAYQQAECGETISFPEESQTGDFAFFDNADGRIIHVGMIVRMENEIRILHASGYVRLDTLDHQGIFRNLDKTYTHNLRIIKRIL